jgi:hypothetical protein
MKTFVSAKRNEETGGSKMRAAKKVGIICILLIIGLANAAVAADGDVYSGQSDFSTDKSTKARESPFIGVALPIPADIVEGVEFQVDCLLEARKNHKGRPRKGVSGTLALFAIALDVGSRTWEFYGLQASGIAFKTKKDGTSFMTSGPVTAGAWATDSHPTNDFISAKVNFSNNKKIKETSLYCEIVVGG